MLNVHIICVGKLKERFYEEAAAEYVKRLAPECRLSVSELAERRLSPSPSPAEIRAALAREGREILSRLPEGFYTVALCVEGQERTSRQLAALIHRLRQDGVRRGLAFVIGGSFGLDEAVKTRADLCLSLSPMTFPHHLARVILLEQIYRAFKIIQGSAYHK